LSQEIPVLRFEQKISDVCLSILIFLCVCAEQYWCRFRSNCKIFQEYVKWCTVDSDFLDLKILSHWFRSKTSRSWEWRTSRVVTEVSCWRRRKFFNHLLTVSSFLFQNRV
jgi:hypothetical protein